MAAPELLLRQIKQDQCLSHQLWLGSSQMGQVQGLSSSLLTETTKPTSPLTSPSTWSWQWCPLWEKLYRELTQEDTLSVIHSCTFPLFHSNPLWTMLFKSLFYCSWLIMFLCSLGWQYRLSSICTSASEILLWSTTVIHLPGHDDPKNSLILVFLVSNKTAVSLPEPWSSNSFLRSSQLLPQSAPLHINYYC